MSALPHSLYNVSHLLSTPVSGDGSFTVSRGRIYDIENFEFLAFDIHHHEVGQCGLVECFIYMRDETLTLVAREFCGCTYVACVMSTFVGRLQCFVFNPWVPRQRSHSSSAHVCTYVTSWPSFASSPRRWLPLGFLKTILSEGPPTRVRHRSPDNPSRYKCKIPWERCQMVS